MPLLWFKRSKIRVTFSSVVWLVLFCLVADSASYHVLGFNLWTSFPLSSLFNYRALNSRGLIPSLLSSFSLDLTSRLGAPLPYLKLEGLATETQLPWAQHFFSYAIIPILPPVTSFLIFEILVLSSWVSLFIIFSAPGSLVLSDLK